MARIKEEDLRLNLIINGDETRKKMGEFREEISKTKNTIKGLESERKKLVKQYGEESVQVKNLDKQLESHRNGLKKLRDNYKDYERRLSLTGMTQKELAGHARTLTATLRNLQPGTAEWKKYNDELLKTKQRMTELKRQSSETGKALQVFGTLKGAYVGITAAVYGVARVFGSAVNTMKEFEQANANLASILGTSVDGISSLTSEAERLGRTTSYTASEVTGLQIELAKLGFTQGQIQAMEEPVLHFATAVGTTLPEAAALAGATLRMFGLRASDAEDTLGALAVSTNKSALSFSYLQTAMSIVGPVARTFGFSVKDTTALLGTLANAGFDASSAATATRNILLNLADANGKLAKELGGPVKTFPELISGLQRLDEKGLDLAATLDLTDKRSVAAFNQFLRGAGDANELRDALENVDGELQRIADERMNTLQGATLRLKSAWEGFILKLRGSTGILKKVTDALAGMIQMITPGSRHDNNVDAVVAQIKNGEETTDTIAEHIEINQKKIDALQQKLDESHSKREKRRLQKLIKEGQERQSVLREALLRVAPEDTGSPIASPGTTPTPGGNPTVDPDENKKTWSLQNDESFLKAKAELTRQFNEGEIRSQLQYEEQLYQLELSSYKARLLAHKDTGAARAKIEADMAKTTMDYNEKVKKKREEEVKKVQELEKQALQAYIAVTEDRKKKTEAQIKLENTRFEAEKKQYAEKKDSIVNYQQVVETLELQHQNNLRKIRLDAFNAELKDLESHHNQTIAEIQGMYAYELSSEYTSLSDKTRMRREKSRAEAEENAKYLFQQLKSLDSIVKTGEINGEKVSKEQLQAYELKAAQVRKLFEEAAAEMESYGRKSGEQILKAIFAGTGGGSLFGVSQSDWTTLFQNIKEATFGAKDLQTAISGIGGAAQEGFKLASKAIDLTNAKEQAAMKEYIKANDQKKTDLEKHLSAGLITQAQYEREVEQLEKDREAKEEEMAIRQAERQKKLNLVQAIINTALGVTKTLAEWGIPWGIAPAAIMAAMGAAEVAMIAATPVTGREQGGPFDDGDKQDGTIVVKRKQDGRQFPARLDPRKRGFINRPTVLVGENGSEYVIPHEAMENPSIRPFINSIETARQNGQLKNLRLEAVRPEVTMTGRVSGGFFSGEQGGAATASEATPQWYAEMLDLLRKMNVIFSKPIKADVSMLGRHGLVETQEEYNRLKKNGRL